MQVVLVLAVELFPSWSKSLAVSAPGGEELDEPWVLGKDLVGLLVDNELVEVLLVKDVWMNFDWNSCILRFLVFGWLKLFRCFDILNFCADANVL
jgi:hypothetical protein